MINKITHRHFIRSAVAELESYFREDEDLLLEDVEDGVRETRREIGIHLKAFQQEGLLTDKEAAILARYAEGLLLTAQADWEIEHCW